MMQQVYEAIVELKEKLGRLGVRVEAGTLFGEGERTAMLVLEGLEWTPSGDEIGQRTPERRLPPPLGGGEKEVEDG